MENAYYSATLEQFILALMILAGESQERPHCIRKSFPQEPDWAVTSSNPEIASLLKNASKQEGE